MKRKIIRIDAEKCTGCGLCVDACHEGALKMIDGKARLISEAYCDGLGACLPKCPADAITIEERDAAAFDEQAVKAAQHPAAAASVPPPTPKPLACGCPGTMARSLTREPRPAAPVAATAAPVAGRAISELRQWPCQIKLVPVNAPYFDNAHLLIAADCAAFAHANLHADYMRGKITLIGCPKLDAVDYAEKLGAILAAHDIRSLTVLRMEVPCCGGLVDAARRAMASSGKIVPWQVVTIGTEGDVIEE
jgi:NAD-dependent dihydropyrimidine dehydrogenase PreA subunit